MCEWKAITISHVVLISDGKINWSWKYIEKLQLNSFKVLNIIGTPEI